MFLKARDHLNRALRAIPVWLVYIVGGALPFWFLYLGLTGGLGVEPIKALEHELGKLGLQALILGLAVTPLRVHVGVNLIRFRRAIGVLTYTFITSHLLVWLLLDVQILSEIWKDILKRPYITVGMAGFVLMTPLAMTSNNFSVRWLGPSWRKLHKLVYPTALLGGVHYMMVGKVWEADAFLYMAAILALLLWRLNESRKKRRKRQNSVRTNTRVA